MSKILFQNKDQTFRVCLEERVYNQMLHYCSISNPYETGGIIIGCYTTDQTIAKVLHATPPPPSSKQLRHSFCRSNKGLVSILDNMWKDGSYYLGEWHYHPNFSPEPSRTDFNQMITLANDYKLHCPEPILIIIGGNSINWEISISIISGGQKINLELAE